MGAGVRSCLVGLIMHVADRESPSEKLPVQSFRLAVDGCQYGRQRDRTAYDQIFLSTKATKTRRTSSEKLDSF